MARRYRALAIACISALLGACSNLQSPVGGYLGLNTDLTVSFKVGNDINPDENGNPSPLYIRFYELKEAINPQEFEFVDIYKKEDGQFSKAVSNYKVLPPFFPGKPREEKFVLKPDTQYVVLFGEFKDYASAHYMEVIPVVKNNVITTAAYVSLYGNRLTATERSFVVNE